MNPAELRLASEAIGTVAAVSGTNTDFRAHGRTVGGCAFLDHDSADLMTQDIAIGHKPACHQRMVGTAKARIGYPDQYLVGRYPIIGNLLEDESPGFTKYNSFHNFPSSKYSFTPHIPG
jgi:hypothetical protein